MSRGVVAGTGLIIVLGLWAPGCATRPQSTTADGPRVVLVTLDGVRWQEVFRGADAGLLAATATRASPVTLAAYLRPGAQAARRALVPFLWDTVATRGQLFGNTDVGSAVGVSNAARISYPGYHEMLTGFTRASITDNRPQPNPDVTVLEWLHRRPGFAGSVAAYASWDVFRFILNQDRSGIPVSRWPEAGLPSLVDRLRQELPPPWKDSVYDAFVFRSALQFLTDKRPRVLHIALGDTDEWAHAGRYDRYLEALHRCDGWLRELWQALDTLPAYRGRTSLIVTTDHGRGDGEAWTTHDAQTPGSEQGWVAVLGPTVPATGERRDHPPLGLAQVAATIAALAGENYAATVSAAAPPLPLGQK
jgi:Type I phosphodiesterase / nucleotide pyrophosphatase